MKNPFSLKDAYKKVYVIDFKKGLKPVFSKKDLNPLGTWYKHTGTTWICQSKLSIEDFKSKVLSKLNLTEKDIVSVKTGTWPVAVLS